MVDTPASVRLERGRKRATGLGRQEGGLCENPRVEDSTLESRAKKRDCWAELEQGFGENGKG